MPTKKIKDNTVDEVTISTQNMIADARVRREHRKKIFECDLCHIQICSFYILSLP